MQAIITTDQQLALLRSAGEQLLKQKEMDQKLGIARMTLRKVMNDDAPLIVSGKTFTAVNNFLIDQLAKQ